MMKGVRSIDARRDRNGKIQDVRILFGPHYFIELNSTDGEHVQFTLGMTHHGFTADASSVDGELESLINEIRNAHPDKKVD